MSLAPASFAQAHISSLVIRARSSSSSALGVDRGDRARASRRSRADARATSSSSRDVALRSTRTARDTIDGFDARALARMVRTRIQDGSNDERTRERRGSRRRRRARAAGDDANAPASTEMGEKKVARVRAKEADDLNISAFAIAVGVGLAIRFGLARPAELSPQAWNLLSIFVSTVIGLVIKPMPIGAWAFGALTVALATKTLTFTQGLSAITNEVVWLIVVTGFFARAFIKTGFGDRLALLFVSIAGRTTLSLAYGFQIAEALLSPAMPSTTSRAAGVFVPVIKSLDPRTREYLIGQQIQGTSATSTFLLSGAAQNFLAMQIALASGIQFGNPFNAWFVAASVPAFVSLLATPLVIYIIDPPELKDTPDAPLQAAEKLREMGPLSSIEKKMCFALGTTVFLWVFGAQLGVTAVIAAMIGMCGMLIFGVLSWDEALGQKGSWDTLIWFAVLVGFSGQLNTMGVVSWLSGFVSTYLTSMDLGMWGVFAALHVFYFFLHYFFASQSAHVGALYPAFLALLLQAGIPPQLAALSLAFNTNNIGGLTHYASGQAAVYYGAGEISLQKLWKQGLYMSVVNFAIYGTVGMTWWKVIGLY